MKIQLPGHSGTIEFESAGSLTRQQLMVLRQLTLEHPDIAFHVHNDGGALKTGRGRRSPWTVAWSATDGRVRATTIRPDGSGQTSERGDT